MKVSVDANILVYSVDPNDRSKQTIAIEVMRRLALGRNALAEQCLFEFLHVTSRKLGVSIELSLPVVAGWTASLGLLFPEPGMFASAVQLLAQYKLSVWDARLLAVCNGAGMDFLITEDLQDGGKYGSVTAVNPFKVANTTLIDSILPP